MANKRIFDEEPVKFTMRLPRDLHDDFSEYCHSVYRSRSSVLREIVARFMDNVNKTKLEQEL
jgi:hypothetical protein